MVRDVAAVVPVYRPEPSSLLPLVEALLGQGLQVTIADDGSPCTTDTLLRGMAARGVRVVHHRKNAGIARSLNVGLAAAADEGATWLLTVDQDSRLPGAYLDGLIAAAEAAAKQWGQARIGAVAAGAIDDDSGAMGYPVTLVDGIPTTEEVIQTGTLWSVAAMLAVGGFDERLAMDAVDAAACLALRTAGMRIVLAPAVAIGHRLGSARQVRLLGRHVVVSGHSSERRTSILRNRLRLFPAEFRQSPLHAFRTLRRVGVQTALAVTVEDERWAKAKASAKALRPGSSR